MKSDVHGINVDVECIDDQFFVTVKATGTLTHDDYVEMTPVIDEALKTINTPKVRVLVDMTDFEGWEFRAAWDDFKFGLSHGSDFERIALYGHQDWQLSAAKVGSWFIGGEIRSFEDHDDAVHWLTLDNDSLSEV